MTLPAMTLEEHLDEARGLIKHFGMNAHEKDWCRNPDCVDIVVRNMIHAHYNFDESLGFKRSTYIVKAGKYGITTYRNRLAKTKITSIYNLQEGMSIADPINDDLETDFYTINKLADSILKNTKLTKKERNYLELYYIKSMSLPDIGKQLGISKQTIWQGIRRGLDRLMQSADFNDHKEQFEDCYCK